jgi:hypothetical protein
MSASEDENVLEALASMIRAGLPPPDGGASDILSRQLYGTRSP